MDIKRYTMPSKKPAQRAGYELSRTCPGCNKQFPLSEVSWLRPGQTCFKESDPSQCVLVQTQRQWLDNTEQPLEQQLQMAETLFTENRTAEASAAIDRLLDVIFRV
ncbi:MAG: hypothetical protein JSS66_04670 [Armatimonadetes bacterium]|nr:hypothetical protein [Armatimonadota bacterium]